MTPDDIKTLLRKKISDALDLMGDVTVEETKEQLSIPYEKYGASTEATTPVVSDSGEVNMDHFPHRRTGNLEQGVGHVQVAYPDRIVETIYSGRADGDPRVPYVLEFQMGRYYMRPMLARTRQKGTEFLVSALQQTS